MACIIIPETDREFPNLVFVGEAQWKQAPRLPRLSSDPILNRVMLTMRAWYSLELDGTEDVRVVMRNEEGQELAATGIGDGFYELPSTMPVKHGSVYQVEAQIGDRSLKGKTRIPERISLDEAFREDTLIVHEECHPVSKERRWLLPVTWNRSSHALFYRTEAKKGYTTATMLDHSFQPSSMIAYSLQARGLTACSTSLVVEAIDSSYAKIYRAGGTFTFTSEFDKWFRKQNEMTIEGRSNVFGDQALGVVGSVSRAQVEFVTVLGNERIEKCGE